MLETESILGCHRWWGKAWADYAVWNPNRGEENNTFWWVFVQETHNLHVRLVSLIFSVWTEHIVLINSLALGNRDFCYLGNMLCCRRDCDSAIDARCCMAWGKLRNLLPVLTTKHLSPKIPIRCTRPAFALPCSMVVKHGDQTPLTWSGSATMTVPWSIGPVAPKTKTKHPSFATPKTWHWGYYGRTSQSAAQMIWACTACHILYQICHRPSDSWH